jgi:hypothetical protein
MRIERTGPVQRLTPRLERFFVETLRGVALDDLQDAQARKADYACLGGLLAIELKSLDEDASERMDNLTDELRERPDWPLFYGAVPMEAFLKNIDEPEPVRRRIAERIGRAIKNHIHKANKQLAAHEAAFPRKNMVKAVVLANEDHEVYDPPMVAYTVQHLLRREENGAPLYPHIDAVIYLSERHATVMNGLIGFPMLLVEGPSIEASSWKRDITDLFLERWGRWNGIPTFQADPSAQKFEAIDHIPERMRRQELWELEYRRNPYMAQFTNDQVRARFDEVICITSLAFIKDAPLKPPREAIEWSMMSMSHLMLEMGRRAMPITECQHDPARLAAAARRLRLPPQAVSWLERDLGRAA